MKKIIYSIIVVVTVCVGYWLISPFFIVREISESIPVSKNTGETTQILLQGNFTGFDRLHQGSGTVRVIEIDGKKYIRFEDDFTVSNGPDLFVGFGKDGTYVKGSELAPLKGTKGSQNYELPQAIDLSSYSEVWIWCKIFGVGFAKAELIQ